MPSLSLSPSTSGVITPRTKNTMEDLTLVPIWPTKIRGLFTSLVQIENPPHPPPKSACSLHRLGRSLPLSQSRAYFFSEPSVAMRGITSLIDTDKDDSTQFIDENLILSSASESEIPPKPASRLKNADLFTKPKVAPRKQKAVKEAAPKKAKAAGKATATKRKAPEEENSDGASPAAKKSFTAATALSGDELDAATGGSEPKQVTKPKAKRKAKAKGTVERDDVPEIGISQAHPTLAQDGIKMPRVNQNMSDNATVPEVESKDEENKACSPLAPVRKPVPAMSRPRLDDRCVKRAGSASDTERAGGDPNLRRSLVT